MKSGTYTPSDPVGLKRGTDGHKSLRSYSDRTHFPWDDIESALYVFSQLITEEDLPWNQWTQFDKNDQAIYPAGVSYSLIFDHKINHQAFSLVNMYMRTH